MSNLPRDLVEGLEAMTQGWTTQELSDAVTRLRDRYRADHPADAAILDSELDVRAYAAYRMPATRAAAAAVFEEVAARIPGFAPTSMVDLGGGTGAAVWAALSAFPTIERADVLDRSAQVLAAGRELARHGDAPAFEHIDWRQWHAGGASVPEPTDLVVVSYLLGELDEAARSDLVSALGRVAATIVVIEPGTTGGYHRLMAVRDRFIERGRSVVAPCPHEDPCPLVGDWCHFSVRLDRTPLHRRIKGGELGYEDEKFAYLVFGSAPSVPVGSRVIRHPIYRKGAVTLEICGSDGSVQRSTVGKSNERFKEARRVRWGDVWRPQPPQE